MTYANINSDFFAKNVRIAFGRNRQNRSNAADFFCHVIKRDAVSTGDVFFSGVVLPWTEDEYLACGNGFEEAR